MATSSGEVEGVQPMLESAIADVDRRLSLRFELEKSKCTLAQDFPSLDRARLMFDLRQGYVFRARAGLKSETMTKNLAEIAKMVLRHS